MALQITDANFNELVNSGKPMVFISGQNGAVHVEWYLQSSTNWLRNMKVE